MGPPTERPEREPGSMGPHDQSVFSTPVGGTKPGERVVSTGDATISDTTPTDLANMTSTEILTKATDENKPTTDQIGTDDNGYPIFKQGSPTAKAFQKAYAAAPAGKNFEWKGRPYSKPADAVAGKGLTKSKQQQEQPTSRENITSKNRFKAQQNLTTLPTHVQQSTIDELENEPKMDGGAKGFADHIAWLKQLSPAARREYDYRKQYGESVDVGLSRNINRLKFLAGI